MKVLIAYDGSKDAESAIDDLHSCGLPANGTAEVISIAEVWLPPPGSIEDSNEPQSEYVEQIVRAARQRGEQALAEADMLAKFAANRVKQCLPEWDVTARASYGSPGWEILNEAEQMEADLVVVGAQGHSFLSRFILGSISQRVLGEAACSVRIGRGKIDLDSGPLRIVIGFDGSHGALAAVDAVADRHWTPGTEVRLVTVVDPIMPTAIGRFVTPVATTALEINVAERTLIEKSVRTSIEKLTASGLRATSELVTGNAKQALTEDADQWGADCIFVGANAWGSRLERFLIGSTSAAVAARARCSVEVVRRNPSPDGKEKV
jgi:nucleotide-binding universal stress UspA family protein